MKKTHVSSYKTFAKYLFKKPPKPTRFLTALFITVFFSPLSGINIGSDTSVTAFTTQQLVYANHRIAYFSALMEGFKIFELGSTTTFDSLFPVSGTIDLQAGNLELNKNLTTLGETELIPGNIIGNHYALELSKSTTQIPRLSPEEAACEVTTINGDTTNQISINGSNNRLATTVPSVDFSFDSNYAAFGAFSSGNPAGQKRNNVVIYSAPTSTPFTWQANNQVDDTNTNFMQLVRWHPSQYTIATALLLGGSPQLRIHSFTPPSTLTQTDSRAYSTGDVPAVAWHPSGNYLAVAKRTNTGDEPYYVLVYTFNPATNQLGAVVARSANANLTFIQSKAFDWDVTGNYLAAGRSAGTRLTILTFTPNETDPDSGFSDINLPATGLLPSTTLGLRWHPLVPNLIGIACGANATVGTIRVLQFDATEKTISVYAPLTGTAETRQVNSIDWGSCGNCLSAVYNSATGNNHRMFTFSPSLQTITGGGFMSIGTVNILETRFDRSGQFIINSLANNLGSARRAMISGCTAPICRTFSNLTIYLNNNLFMHDICLTFSGDCSIIGRMNTLSLAPTCTLQIAPASTLMLTDITITPTRDEQIACTANSSTLILNNATLLLDNDFTFSTGTLSIKNNVSIQSNGHTVRYQSNQPCIITKQSRLTVNQGVTFTYDPQTPAANLLQFADNTAQLFLDGGILNAAQNLSLTQGTILIDRAAHLGGTGTISAENNTIIDWLPAAELIAHGSVTIH